MQIGRKSKAVVEASKKKKKWSVRDRSSSQLNGSIAIGSGSRMMRWLSCLLCIRKIFLGVVLGGKQIGIQLSILLLEVGLSKLNIGLGLRDRHGHGRRDGLISIRSHHGDGHGRKDGLISRSSGSHRGDGHRRRDGLISIRSSGRNRTNELLL